LEAKVSRGQSRISIGGWSKEIPPKIVDLVGSNDIQSVINMNDYDKNIFYVIFDRHLQENMERK